MGVSLCPRCEKGHTLDTIDGISRFCAEIRERAEAIAAGFKRLRALGMEAHLLPDIDSDGPDAVLERIEAALQVTATASVSLDPDDPRTSPA